MQNYWYSFDGDLWKQNVNVFDFIVANYKPYDGNSDFLEHPTEATTQLWDLCEELLAKEVEHGILGIDTRNISGVTSFSPGYIDESLEKIVGLQTDEALKRIMNPYGGMRMLLASLDAYDYSVPDSLQNFKKGHIKTHNQGVFDVYSEAIKRARSCGLITGLPDAYGRGRIIGDYRRIALYGIDFLIRKKIEDKNQIKIDEPIDEAIRLKEEVSKQIRALTSIKELALSYGFDVSKPAKNAKEAVQWLYFGYLAAVKENNGAAMSLGRISTFLDIYIQRDLELKRITEIEAQELMDQLVIKLRLVRHLRTPEYNELFAGDPTWITEAIGGMLDEKLHLVTKNSYRFLNTLNNLGAAPEPNMTVLWSQGLPENFKSFCSELSIKTGSIQYENDDLMRPIYGSDYSIACCVSPMETGKTMQFFGARCNLGKALLYSINSGIDEIKGTQVLQGIPKMTAQVLDFDDVIANLDITLDKIAKLYVEAMNIIHYMHDQYAYESSQMALHDTYVNRNMAFGVAGLSVIADSLSAIKYGQVIVKREKGIARSFEIKKDYPKYGNNDQRVDELAQMVLTKFISKLRAYKTYRHSKHTLSVLTITSNVVYGKKTGDTPDGRLQGKAFAPGANPMHGRDESGALASLKSVSNLPFEDVCEDGISNTFTVAPKTLGKTIDEQRVNLKHILDGYFMDKGHHLNVNVLDRKTLLDAQENPAKYPNLTIRVSGYAVKFNRLNEEQQNEVISRTIHQVI